MTDQDTFDVVAAIEALGLPTVGRADAVHMFTSEPGRLVRSSPYHGSLRFWSERFGIGLQGEGRILASGYLTLSEFTRPDLRALIDEPDIKITFVHEDPDGRKFPITLKPDYAELTDTGLPIVDVMQMAEILRSAEKHPGLYTIDDAGIPHCPAAEAWAAERGFTYRLVTERDLPSPVVANWTCLSDAARAERPPLDELDALVARVVHEPGVRMGVLVREGFDARTIKWAIAHERIATNLSKHVLAAPDHLPLFADAQVCSMLDAGVPASWAIGGDAPHVLDLRPGLRLTWQGNVATVIAAAGDEVLLDIDGETTPWKRRRVVEMWRAGSLQLLADARPLAGVAHDVALERYRQASRKDLDTALARSEILRCYEEAKTDPEHPGWSIDPKGRRRFRGRALTTLEEWARDRERVRAATGDNLAGLVPEPNHGNDTSRLDSRVDAIFRAVVIELWATPDRIRVRAVNAELMRRCTLAGLTAPHRRTVRERLRKLTTHDIERLRLGEASAYRTKPHDRIDPDSVDPNGCHPNHVVHIDHTVVDDEMVSVHSAESLGRLKLSRAVDGCSRREICHRFTFGSIDGATVIAILTRYAEATGRMPEVIVLDLDPAHRSVELLAFCEAYGITIVWRRTRRSRDSWVVERGFKTANDELFHNLRGNTQVMRAVREVGKDNDPRRRAVHVLVTLDELYRRWVAERNGKFHPILGASPDTAWDEGIVGHGVGRHVRVDDRMRFLAMPFADGTTRVIRGKDGVVVTYLRYEHDAFEALGIDQTAEVRVDPDDVSRVVVLHKGRHYVAICKAIARLRVISRNELALLSELIRKDLRDAQRLETEFERRLAILLADARAWERTQVAMRAEAERQLRRGSNARAGGRDASPPSATPDPDLDTDDGDPYWAWVWDEEQRKAG